MFQGGRDDLGRPRFTAWPLATGLGAVGRRFCSCGREVGGSADSRPRSEDVCRGWAMPGLGFHGPSCRGSLRPRCPAPRAPAQPPSVAGAPQTRLSALTERPWSHALGSSGRIRGAVRLSWVWRWFCGRRRKEARCSTPEIRDIRVAADPPVAEPKARDEGAEEAGPEAQR